MKKLMLAMMLAALCALPALAAQDTVRIFLWDNDAGETAQEAPAAVMDRYYNSTYVWADRRDGNWNIYGRVWQRNPAPLTPSFLVNTKAQDNRDQRAPDVAGKSGEYVFVVWQDSIYKEPFWQIYGHKMKPDGSPLSEDFRINKIVAKNAKFPKVAVNPINQRFVVVWQDERNGDWDIYARLFDYDCKPISDDIKISQDPDKYHQVLPAVSYSEKYIAITWQDHRPSRPSIFLRYYKDDLNPLTNEARISENVEVPHLTPAIAANDTGFFTIAWINFTGNALGNIYAQRFDPDAKPIDKNFQVNLPVYPVACRIPSIVMNADNVSFWVSWADSMSTDRYEIKARYFDYAARWEKVKLVNQNPANGQRAPAVCRFGEWFSVAWMDSSRTTGLGDIFGQYFTNSVKAEQDTLKKVDINYHISKDKESGRKIWYHPKKDYDNPYTTWNEDPIAEPDSLYIPLDSAYVLAIKERNIPNQNFFQITNTDILEYAWRKQGKLNSSEAYDICLMDLGYAEDGSTAGVIQPEQLDSLMAFSDDSLKCLIVAGNDFGEMYNSTALFSRFGSKYDGPGDPVEVGNMSKLEGIAGTFTEGMMFDYPYRQGPDNSVDVVMPYLSGSQLIMGSDGGKDKWSRGRATTYGDYYKGDKAATLHRNVYLTFSIGSLSNGRHPSTASELTRRILAYQGYNVEPEPIVDLVDSVYTVEGTVELSWTAVSDDALTEKASKYWLKYTKYNSSAADQGKMSSEVDFIDTGSTYYQTWVPANVGVREKKAVYGFAPGDTLIFALKAGDESVPTRWSTLGNEPRIVVAGDTVTPHTIQMGYTYGAVKDFCRSEMIDSRVGSVGSRDTLYTTWDASNLYLGYCRNDWRSAGDLLYYFDTQSGGADSTFKYNGTVAAGFDINFRPDFCLVFESGDSVFLKRWNGTSWVNHYTNSTYPATYRYLDSINKYTYAEIRVPFGYLNYTVGNVFKYLAVCQYETNDNPWNAFPVTNSITVKGGKVPAKYGAYYQINSLASNLSPRNVAVPHAVSLSLFTAAYEQGAVNLHWRSELEDDHKLWLVERSDTEAGGYARLAELAGAGSGSSYDYADRSALPASEYFYRLGAQDGTGSVEWYGPIQVNTPGLSEVHPYSLQASPNPFGGTCQIRYSLSQPGRVSLKVYDICGHLVKTVFDDSRQPGSYAARWAGDDESGRSMPNGIYFYRLTSGQGCLTQKIIMLK